MIEPIKTHRLRLRQPKHHNVGRLQIGFFTNSYHPVVSGVVKSVSNFRWALTTLGHNVFIFAQEDNYKDTEPFVYRYPSIPLPISADAPAAIPISNKIDWLLPTLKLDVIHTHHPVLLGQVGAAKANQLDIPLIFSFHTQYQAYTHYVPLPQDTVQNFLDQTVHDWVENYIRKCNHIIVPSESMLDILKSQFGLESQYTVIPTGIDLTPFKQSNGHKIREQLGWDSDFVMISAGRLSKEKNWEFLLSAAAQVIQTQPEFRVALLGDGPDRENLEEFTAQLGIRDRVDFLGEVSFEDVPAYLGAADFFGFSSTSETQGLVTLEALAAALPVVAVDASGTRDILEHEQQGLLVEEDVRAFSNAILQLHQNRSLRQKLSQAAVKRAGKFDINAQANRLVDVYHQAIQDKKANRTVKLLKPN